MDARDIAIRTIIGEAANEGPEGWAAVANVLRNRAADPRWPEQIAEVALQPKQFSAWNSGAGGNDLVNRYGPDDSLYQRVGAVVDHVLSGQGQDNTGGATHYYSPAGMRALVNQGAQSNTLPNWLQQENQRRSGAPTRIGGHIFTGMAEGSAQTAPMGPAGAPTPAVSRATAVPTPQAPGMPQQQSRTGFTAEQISRAFQRAREGDQQPGMQAPQQQAAQFTPLERREGYSAREDALTRVMRAVQSVQQKRRGLLG